MRTLPASAIEKGLPSLPFGLWIDQTLVAPLEWALTDCGETPAARSVGYRNLCVRFEEPSRELTAHIVIGTTERGIQGQPEVFLRTMKLFDVHRDVARLADLPGLVREAEERSRLFVNHPLREIASAAAVRAVRDASADTFDPLLPRRRFGEWLMASMPRAVAFRWSMEECSGRRTQPQCVWVIARWADGSTATIKFDLELLQRGLSVAPAFSQATIYFTPAGRYEKFQSLTELAEAVRAFAFKESPR